jgi:indolepyruvate ferredoxin oxidoreductase beta subunit
MNEYNIVVVGVGGQGVLFISEILGDAAVGEGLNVRIAEIHGMAQRGGSVICNVRFGEKVYSPTIMEGSAHLFIGLEPIEVIRHLKFANPNTVIVLNTTPIIPSSTYLTGVEYPLEKTLLDEISKTSKNLIPINATEIALKTKMVATQNIVLLGILIEANILPLKEESLINEIIRRVPEKYEDINLEALELGKEKYRSLKNSQYSRND